MDAGELDYWSMLTFLEAVRLPAHPFPDQALHREFQAYLLLRYRIQVATVVVLETRLCKILVIYEIHVSHVSKKRSFSPDGGLSEFLELCNEGAERLSNLPQVATFMFIWLALGKFLTCCLKILRWRCNLGLRDIMGFKNLISANKRPCGSNCSAIP